MDQVRPHVCSWHSTTLPKIGRPILSNPIRWRPARRPRTEARPRRTDVSQVKKGIDKPRPVTEADIYLALIRLAHAARERHLRAVHRGRCGAVRLTGVSS